jgi:hypothetical protein
MLSYLKAAFRRLLVGPTLDPITFDELRKAHPTPCSRLGTVKEALQTLQEAIRTAHPPGHWKVAQLYGILMSLQDCIAERSGNIETKLGHLLTCRGCGYGYEVLSGQDGWTLEELDSPSFQMQVLRQHGFLVATSVGVLSGLHPLDELRF